MNVSSSVLKALVPIRGKNGHSMNFSSSVLKALVPMRGKNGYSMNVSKRDSRKLKSFFRLPYLGYLETLTLVSEKISVRFYVRISILQINYASSDHPFTKNPGCLILEYIQNDKNNCRVLDGCILALLSMAAKPLTSEAIALTEKKMDMTLDDIIKMSKTSTSKAKNQRVSNKSQKFSNGSSTQGKSSKVRSFMDSRSSLRQGVLAQRRSNFTVNQFPLATKAAAAPIRNRALNRNRVVNWNKPRLLSVCRFGATLVQRKATDGGFTGKQHPEKAVPKQRPQTLDSLFANMKEQRMRVLSQHNNARRQGTQQQQRRGRGRHGNFGF
ncbi:hypothetical protein HHK36_029147 [Tetracentron sinense]|uniref:Uncharacterized protein n=1 Tax=Tetracentron sinense TaxID=13715 RepID=A0A834YCI6_TETSI|nr:hypothetical protein HHK36_029147 [Tetracentron sinense]